MMLPPSQRMDAIDREHERWRRENLLAEAVTNLGYFVQNLAVDLRNKFGLELKGLELARLPQFYETKPNPPDQHALEVLTAVGVVRVTEPSPEGVPR